VFARAADTHHASRRAVRNEGGLAAGRALLATHEVDPVRRAELELAIVRRALAEERVRLKRVLRSGPELAPALATIRRLRGTREMTLCRRNSSIDDERTARVAALLRQRRRGISADFFEPQNKMDRVRWIRA